MDSTTDGRVLNEVMLLDHAHPENVPGHGMKGGVHMSTGYLLNPEMKKNPSIKVAFITIMWLMSFADDEFVFFSR